jgi:hypothetical protein
MNGAKLVNLAPMLIMIGFLAYVSNSIPTTSDKSAAGPTGLTKGVDAVVRGMVTAGDVVAGSLTTGLRDPFHVDLKRDAAAEAAKSQEEAAHAPTADALSEILQGLTLEATFRRGTDQMAIINGRVYSRGQPLLLDGNSDQSLPPLLVFNVLPTKVVLEASGKYLVLGYPDRLVSRSNKWGDGPDASQAAMIDDGGQAAMFQKLLNSPLGALGKSLIGNPGKTASRSGRSRSPRAATAARRAGNP